MKKEIKTENRSGYIVTAAGIRCLRKVITEWGVYEKKEGSRIDYKPDLSLNELAQLYQTDKGGGPREKYGWATDGTHDGNHPLGYVTIYEKYMKELREKPASLFEIGVCDDRAPLGSVKMWLSYFKHAEIFSFDMNDAIVEEAISLGANHIHGDQGDVEFWEKTIYPELGDTKFDFIIEDGSHSPHDMLTTLVKSVDLIKPGGYYFMEDIQDPCTTFGGYGYHNGCVYCMVQEFRDTGDFGKIHGVSPALPEEEELSALSKKLEFVEMYHGGPKTQRTLMAVFRRK